MAAGSTIVARLVSMTGLPGRGGGFLVVGVDTAGAVGFVVLRAGFLGGAFLGGFFFLRVGLFFLGIAVLQQQGPLFGGGDEGLYLGQAVGAGQHGECGLDLQR
jgi:hypothetical protein